MESKGEIKYHKNLAKYFTSKFLYLDEPTQKKPNTPKPVMAANLGAMVEEVLSQ